MDSVSGAALARALGTSVPRVVRAADRLGLDARRPNGRYAFTPSQVDRLRRELGSVSPVDGLSRSQVIALAGLRSAPFGLVSARAVARRTGLSATAAARALESLSAAGLAERRREAVAAGRAREMEVWRATVLHPRWPALDPLLARVEAPRGGGRPRREGERVPRRLRHLFWNTAESQLDVELAGPYIARRLLRVMDLQGLAWGAQALAPRDWERAALARGLDPKTRRLARNLAAAAEAR